MIGAFASFVPRPVRAFVVAAAALSAAACHSGAERDRGGATPLTPSPAPSTAPAHVAPAAATADGGAGMALPSEAAGLGDAGLVAFPPRNEPFEFRRALENTYRVDLGRGPAPTYVDLEGDIVWTQEYLRYRVNGCDHETATSRVLQQIGGGGIGPVCGDAPAGVVAFPPRNEPYAFRLQLETVYRDALRRGPTLSAVDIEGAIVWTQEYLRYRVNGCEHLQAQAAVFKQIGGGGIDPVCGGVLNGTWDGRLIDFPGGRTFRMTLSMVGERVTGSMTGDGTGGGGFVTGRYPGSGPVHLEADFGDGKQYFDGDLDGPTRIRGTSTYNGRPPVYRFEMTR
jgi:hypothetical protein